jgi:hypothetical protein
VETLLAQSYLLHLVSIFSRVDSATVVDGLVGIVPIVDLLIVGCIWKRSTVDSWDVGIGA